MTDQPGFGYASSTADAPPRAPVFADAGWAGAAPPPPPPPPRRRRRPLRATAAVLGLLLLGLLIGVPVGLLTRSQSSTGTATPAATATPNAAAAARARTLYQQALAAMRASSSFHYVARAAGGASQTIVGDALPNGGRQLITVDSPAGTEQFTLVLVSGTVYFQGNAAALEDQLGVPAAKAATLVGQAISVTSGNGPYAVVAPGITVADQTQETKLAPTSTLPVTTTGGASATRLVGNVPAQSGAPGGTGHLDVLDGSHLPTSYVTTATLQGITLTSTATFSAWGTAVSVSAPANPVAWSSLGASEPQGGYGSGGGLVAPSPTP